MNSTFVIESNSRETRRGFALVVALSLMAFMLVLVVTLLSLMEVETRSADNSLELEKAREGARMALNMAVGQLQEYAGDDERVTARAEILGSNSEGGNRFKDEARYWTGVWKTSGSSAGWPKWLVSWHTPNSEPDPNSLPADSVLMLLVGAGSGVTDTSNYVYAPGIDVLGKDGNVTSRIAWWIGDEGVKASVAQLPLNQRANNPSFTSSSSLDSLQTMLTSTQGLEEVLTDYDRFISDEAKSIDRINNITHLFDADGLNLSFSSSGEEAFHALTPMSLGLLASTNGSGLMEDLSCFPDQINISTNSQAEFASYVNSATDRATAKSGIARGDVSALKRSVSLRGLEDSITSTPASGDIVNIITPILTNFMMAFSVYETNTQVSSNTLLKMHFFCEFWNPYTSSLLMKEDTGNPTSDNLVLELEILGLPKVLVQAFDAPGDVIPVNTGPEIDLQTVLGKPGEPGNPVIIRLNYDQQEDWLPGMTKNWTGITGSAGTQQYASSQSVSSLDDTVQTTTKNDWNAPAYTLGGTSEFDVGVTKTSSSTPGSGGNYNTIKIITSNPTGSSPAPTNTLVVKVYSLNLVTDERVLLTQLNGVEYNEVNTLDTAINDPAVGDVNFGFHFILKGPDSSSFIHHRGDWLSNVDPRSSNWLNSYDAVINGASAQSKPASPEVLRSGVSNAIAIEVPSRLFDRSDGTGNYYKDLWQDSPLFEVPRERLLSLASLQHLHFYNEPPFKVGNSWGDESGVNTLAWFDQYYFSGLSLNDQSPDETFSGFEQYNGFPNPVLTTYQYSDTSDFAVSPKSLAQNVMVKSRFNINSTSVEAWKSVLGGLRINNWPYLNYSNPKPYPSTFPPVAFYSRINSSDLRKAVFTRFSDSSHETYNAPITPEDFNVIAPSEFYRRGARYLSSTQIGTLAQQIVNRIKARVQGGDTPFFSMQDFLNNPNSATGSILEEAIQASVFTNPLDNEIQQWDRSWETTGIVGDDTDRIDIDHFSPGFLTQADIMTAIGPMLAPRSDTFKIRARCQMLSPFDLDDIIGDATIEAVVQRVPEQVDGDNNIDDSSARKFKIVSIRWLTEDEI